MHFTGSDHHYKLYAPLTHFSAEARYGIATNETRPHLTCQNFPCYVVSCAPRFSIDSRPRDLFCTLKALMSSSPLTKSMETTMSTRWHLRERNRSNEDVFSCYTPQYAEDNKAFMSEIFTRDWVHVYEYSIFTGVVNDLDCSLEQRQHK